MGWTLSITDLIFLVSQLVKFGDVGMAYMYQTFGLWVPRLLELGGGGSTPKILRLVMLLLFANSYSD